MAEALVAGIIQQLAKITAQSAGRELSLVKGVEEEAKNLERNFKAIQCVLEDAEQKQLVNKSVGLWLERLKQVSYDMEDVLDEWQTDPIRLHSLALKIKEINEELDKIAKEKERYQLATRSNEMKRPESTSFVDVSKLHGLDVVKDKIVGMLFDHDEDWEPLRATFEQGMPESRILVTTRKESVAIGLVKWHLLESVMRDCGSLEDVGREITKKCKGLPLAAKTLGGQDGTVRRCKMHDIVHDFVQHLTSNEIVALAVYSRAKNWRLDSSSSFPDKAHHLRLTMVKDYWFPKSISGIEKLRSLVTISNSCIYRPNSVKVIEIPKEIGKLIHLRYLDLSYSEDLLFLPEEVCELKNLQYLNLYHCVGLQKLPDSIGKLINLRFLLTSECRRLTYYPKGIGRLTLLRELNAVVARLDIIDYSNEFGIGDLENLDLLRGEMEIGLVGNLVSLGELKWAKLRKKIHLAKVKLHTTAVGRHGIEVDRLIQALNPPSSLDIQIRRWTPSPPPQISMVRSESEAVRDEVNNGTAITSELMDVDGLYCLSRVFAAVCLL
ncbi:hypothetical protein COLO4_29255 [Corchorus olitorius]|uniref:Rx N-terminal domain-containing protein n=1 Tax=Corchorus olitorius TaxID=93759 RepID=A0A1R3HFJ7_9ROSI|nr:hypothetical protein COLO4_29255 [Corchorus olitorius]